MSEPVAPLPPSDESNLKIGLRLIGTLGLIFGLIPGFSFGGWWWLCGIGVFVGSALLYAIISIVQGETSKGRHR